MIDTVIVFALASFCIIAGFLLSLVQRTTQNQDAIINLLRRIEIINTQTMAACEASRDAFLKPVEIEQYKPPGAYAIGPNGDMEALVKEANKRINNKVETRHPIL